MNIRFYTLLYVDLDEQRLLGGITRKGTDRISLFLRNAAMLDKSLRANNKWCKPLTILTNNQELIKNIAEDIGYEFSIKSIDFNLSVPKGIKFYSAHYKIDTFNYFSSRPDDEYSILLDNDIVAIRPFSREFMEITEAGIPMCYHLSIGDTNRMMDDCRKIIPNIPVLQWTGGELWGGTNKFYASLYNESLKIAKSYFSQIDSGLFHIGDEMITSLAFGNMSKNGLYYVDSKNLNILYRYWGMHEKESLLKYNPILAHFPADKIWIASLSLNDEFISKNFLKHYNRHWNTYKLIKKIKTLIGRK